MKSLVLLKLAHLGIALALVFGALGAMRAAAQATVEPAESLAPQARLADLLRPDGTLDLTTGFRGSVDTHGYRLVSSADGVPALRRPPEMG